MNCLMMSRGCGCAGGTRPGFLTHLSIFIAVNTLLVIINLTTSPQYLWFVWPLLGWGVCLAFHGIAALGERASRRPAEERNGHVRSYPTQPL